MKRLYIIVGAVIGVALMILIGSQTINFSNTSSSTPEETTTSVVEMTTTSAPVTTTVLATTSTVKPFVATDQEQKIQELQTRVTELEQNKVDKPAPTTSPPQQTTTTAPRVTTTTAAPQQVPAQ